MKDLTPSSSKGRDWRKQRRGSWYGNTLSIRPANRNFHFKIYGKNTIGFRLVQDR